MVFFCILTSSMLAVALGSPLQFERVPIHTIQNRVPNPCQTKANDACIFPFTYNSVVYYRCTYADSPTPWCATMVDPNNTVVTNQWGDCSTSQYSSCPEDTPELTACTAVSGAACVFPFRHLGITYSSCATTDDMASAWCSTGTQANGTHIVGNEGVCPSTCPGADASSTTTTSSTTASPSTTTTATTTTTASTTTTTVSTSTTTASTTTTTAATTTTTAAADTKRSCSTISGPAAGKQCVFPFTFSGTTHTSCAEWVFGGEDQGKMWCSTKVDANGDHADGAGEYGFCSPDCSPVSLLDIIQELLGSARTEPLSEALCSRTPGCVVDTIRRQQDKGSISFV